MPQQTYPVKIAGRDFYLRYDFGTMVWFEQKSGTALIPALSSHLGPTAMTWLLAAGLRHADPQITFDKAQDLIAEHIDEKGGDFSNITEQIVEALRAQGQLKRERPTRVGAGPARTADLLGPVD